MADQGDMTGHIEASVEDDVNDNDSTLADSDSNSTTHSVTSSIYDYEKAHGRTYHAYHAGKYVFPNDDRELERVDLTYHAARLAIGDRLFYAPVQDPTAILDVGTGTGIWAMDVADEYPAAEVIGIDLSPTQPTYVPPNLQFQIADGDEEWTFRQQFDLVHTRIMNDMSLKDWPNYFRQAYAATKPGGWVEAQEFSYVRQSDDNTIPPDSKIKHWEDLWTEGIQKVGLQGTCDPELVVQQMSAAGFQKISRLSFKWPVGVWPRDQKLKECGYLTMMMLMDGYHGLSVKVFTQLLGWSVEEMEILLAECRSELKRKDIHGYWPMWVIYGQKPL